MIEQQKIILASSSRFRSMLLQKAGIIVSRETPNVDERVLEQQYHDKSPTELALLLAKTKAEEVSRRFLTSLVIGGDQILACEGKIFHKVKNKQQAYERLAYLSAKTHILHTSIAVYQSGYSLWQYSDSSHLTMRSLTKDFIEAYLQQAGDDVLTTAGIYQIEGRGIQLFEKIIGDHYSIIGLPLLPLLIFLRSYSR